MLDMGFAVGAAVGMFGIFMPLYLKVKKDKETALSLTFKGLCTLIAVLLCFAGALRSGTAFSWWMTAGLFVCMAADIAIGIQFIAGVFVFLIGHLCYITAFLSLAPYSSWSLLVFAAVLALAFGLFRKTLDKAGNAKIPLCVYAAVISAMLSIAVLLPVTLGRNGLIPAAGAVLFVLSDMLLARNMYIRMTRLSDAFCLTCYYAGQYLLALGVFLVIK